jgi:hypothetical protein
MVAEKETPGQCFIGCHAGNVDDQDKVDLTGNIVALLDFGRGDKTFFCGIDEFGLFTFQRYFCQDGDELASSGGVDDRDIGGNDALLLHPADAALDGGSGKVDLCADGALRCLVVRLQDLQDVQVKAV